MLLEANSSRISTNEEDHSNDVESWKKKNEWEKLSDKHSFQRRIYFPKISLFNDDEDKAPRANHIEKAEEIMI